LEDETMNAKTIELSKDSGAWMADFLGDMDVLGLFGTTRIPTAYTDRANADAVLADIKRRNPQHYVYVRPESERSVPRG
jgi:hypothetical protein